MLSFKTILPAILEFQPISNVLMKPFSPHLAFWSRSFSPSGWTLIPLLYPMINVICQSHGLILAMSLLLVLHFWALLILPSEKAMASHSSTLAWKIPWTEEPGGLQSMRSRRVGHDWATSLSLFTFHFHALEKEMATHSSVLAWRIPGTGEPDGLPSMGLHRVGHDWIDLAAAAATLPQFGPSLQHVQTFK